jgi:hypothetical protein
MGKKNVNTEFFPISFVRKGLGQRTFDPLHPLKDFSICR